MQEITLPPETVKLAEALAEKLGTTPDHAVEIALRRKLQGGGL